MLFLKESLASSIFNLPLVVGGSSENIKNLTQPIMAKFVTKYGSYTLVLKPKGTDPIYNHKGAPVRVEGTLYAEFKNVKGTSIGVFETEDTKMINALRQNNQFGKAFTEMKEEEFKAATAPVQANMVKVPQAALMACTKNELTSIAKQYNLQIDDDMTKAIIVDLILKSQDAGPVPKEEAPAQVFVEGGIKQIVQEVGTSQ